MKKTEKTTNPAHDDIRMPSQKQYMQTPLSHTHTRARTYVHTQGKKEKQLEGKFRNISCFLSLEGEKELMWRASCFNC